MRFAPNWAHMEWVKCIVRDEKLGTVIKFDHLLLWREYHLRLAFSERKPDEKAATPFARLLD